MDIKIKAKCKKNGKMLPHGESFCHKNVTYDAVMVVDENLSDEEKYFYFVQDELSLIDEDSEDWHSMDKEFFDEYFEFHFC